MHFEFSKWNINRHRANYQIKTVRQYYLHSLLSENLAHFSFWSIKFLIWVNHWKYSFCFGFFFTKLIFFPRLLKKPLTLISRSTSIDMKEYSCQDKTSFAASGKLTTISVTLCAFLMDRVFWADINSPEHGKCTVVSQPMTLVSPEKWCLR